MGVVIAVVVIVVLLALLGLGLSVRIVRQYEQGGVDKNTSVVFPAPLMSTIAELGSFLATEQAAAARALPPSGGADAAP